VTTMQDVARRAGVSLSTVSHVVNGTRHVDPETAAEVRRVIEAMAYAPNVLARSLVRSTTNTVGIAISVSTNYYFTDIVAAIERAFAARGQMVLLCDTRDDPETELKVVRALHERRVDGLILAPSADPEQRAIRYLAESKVPSVLVDRLSSKLLDGVGIQNKHAMGQLIDHLAGHSHKRIALVAGQAGFKSTLERVEGFRVAMQRNGLTVDEALVRPANDTVAQAAQSTRELLSMAKRPTAIAAGNNLATIGVMRAVHEAGMRVPQDLALMSFDDFEWADSFEPRLSVIAQPCDLIGQRAAEMLAARIKSPGGPTRSIRLASTLVIRRSCGCNA